MPTLPISKKQLDKLGDRLRDAASPAAEDFELLEQVLGAYDEALQCVRTRLLELGFEPTVRLKTTGTIVDKLRRDRSSSLKTIQDLAGARIVLAGTLRTQDAAAQTIMESYAAGPVLPLLVDRRADPRAGYRALHVILRLDGIPVEVQIRTELQDLWAQLFERLADTWGRQIRYGGPPNSDGSESRVQARRRTVAVMMRISEVMARSESLSAALEELDVPTLLQTAGVDASASDEEIPAKFREVRSQYLEVSAQEIRLEAEVREMLTMVAEVVGKEVTSG
ncbi:hypothetical protein AB0J80_12360 [Actinoplanes sp. NPDC049548]|uniref:hypothetical protein n=1 Tax=Actinoplanes sp. NPDC049548 TaxID=3155152 RepID=UPI00342FADC0